MAIELKENNKIIPFIDIIDLISYVDWEYKSNYIIELKNEDLDTVEKLSNKLFKELSIEIILK